uniref:Uncharacterized protein n=1 Tax=Myoviridae sp. ctNQV2 TaxID=2827683 RepID=A0A8S5S0C0_9CAUD|nr:MAG TPA: hypothetical protein [Myoviridae sp. ctNQV2]
MLVLPTIKSRKYIKVANFYISKLKSPSLSIADSCIVIIILYMKQFKIDIPSELVPT